MSVLGENLKRLRRDKKITLAALSNKTGIPVTTLNGIEKGSKTSYYNILKLSEAFNIEANDLNTKVNAAKKFLAKGNKVKITLRFRGREMAHMNASKHILDDIAENLSDVAVVEKAPKVEGRSIGMVLAEKR